MIGHEFHQTRKGWKEILLWDFLIPSIVIFGCAWYLDKLLAKRLIQYFIDLPLVGLRIYKSPFFLYYGHWHLAGFLFIVFLLGFAISFRTARIPGPGRAFLRWWQSLLQHTVKKEQYINPFPPAFDAQKPHIAKLIRTVTEQSPLSRVIGFYKRFLSDVETDERHGKAPESPKDYFPIILDKDIRFRHIQVVGGSGSGKSASIIAPMLREDAASTDIATLTINPKGDIYLMKVMADKLAKEFAAKGTMAVPTGFISFTRPESLAYDPLLYGDADTLTKKIMGSSDSIDNFYKKFQERWLMSFFRVVKTEPLLVDRIMLRHLYQFLSQPNEVEWTLGSFCSDENNKRRLKSLASAKMEWLAGVASHVALLVEDESLSHIFDNPGAPLLNVREIVSKGGNIYLDVDMASKGPQARALGRMILMEIQLLAGARQAGAESIKKGLQVYLDEFASFAYNGFIDLIDKCRSACIGLLLAHQSLANLKRDNLSQSFKDEVVDNTFTKFFLGIKDDTAEWASRLFGSRKVVKRNIAVGKATEQTDTRARESQTISFREEDEVYVQPADFNVGKGYGYAILENHNQQVVKGPVRYGYVKEAELCSNEELIAFLQAARKDHPKRPRNGSLIDNGIPPGEPSQPTSKPPVVSKGESHALSHPPVSEDEFNTAPPIPSQPEEKQRPGKEPEKKDGAEDHPLSGEAMDDLMDEERDIDGGDDA